MSLSAPNKPPLKDRIIPWYFVIAFGVVFAVNAVFVTVAIKSNSGVVTKNAYEKGLAYNDVLEDAKAQAALGWHTTLEYNTNQLVFSIHDSRASAVTGAAVTAQLSRPLTAGYKRDIVFIENSPGVYSADIIFPLKGQWDVTVSSLWNSKQHRFTQRLIVK